MPAQKSRGKSPFGKYPECGNDFLPSNFNAGLRTRPGFLFPSFQLIARFCDFFSGPTITASRQAAMATAPAGLAMEPCGYTFRSNMLQGRITKPETRA
jgi:hypothetical protein